jgi:hypothetical protein
VKVYQSLQRPKAKKSSVSSERYEIRQIQGTAMSRLVLGCILGEIFPLASNCVLELGVLGTGICTLLG